ncbi:MAG TPA: rRNA maturation RNase YbeY [candidate division Zixibacteria bacterium]|nr:rRNA maturation RNase YbeY [candidate division Zixibacteria bacterium]
MLNIFKETEVRLPRTKLRLLFDDILSNETRKKWRGQTNLVFTSDARLRQLNRMFRKKDKSTDVLSFNIDDPVSDESVFGEIYISVPTAQRQASDYGAPLSEEILRLVCHGFLHLLGYDHHEPSEEKIMKRREDRYLRRVTGS